MALLMRSTNATRPALDELLLSKSFFYEAPRARAPSRPPPSAAAESRHMVWFDDADTLRGKYGVARKLGLGGIGFWNIDCLDYSGPEQRAVTAAMLEAVREYRYHRRPADRGGAAS